MRDDERRWIVVHDLSFFDDPTAGYVSRADVLRYLLDQGWRRDGGWYVRGPNEEDLVYAEGASLDVLVARIAAAEGVAPRWVLRAIETLAKRN